MIKNVFLGFRLGRKRATVLLSSSDWSSECRFTPPPALIGRVLQVETGVFVNHSQHRERRGTPRNG